MSDDKTPKRPSHFAYQVSEGQDGKSYFNKVGAAFEHRDGQGYNVTLDSVPVDGRVTLRTPQERLDDMRNDDGGGRNDRGNGRQQRGRNARSQAGPEYER